MPRVSLTRLRATLRPLAWVNLTALAVTSVSPVAAQAQRNNSAPQGTGQGQRQTPIPADRSPGTPIVDRNGGPSDLGKQGPTQLHPLDHTRTSGSSKPPLLRRETLTDYRQLNDPGAQRIRRSSNTTLLLFGYNYFEPARQAIEAHRARFQRILGQDYPGAQEAQGVDSSSGARTVNGTGTNGNSVPGQPVPPQLSREELLALSQLTEAQRADLAARAAQNRLTTDEKIRFGAALQSPGLLESAVQDFKEYDLSSTLSDSQKIDLLTRKRDNLLSDEEKRRYRRFLNGEQSVEADNNGGTAPTPVYQRSTVPQDPALSRPGAPSELYQGPSSANAFATAAGPLEMLWRNIQASVPTNYQLAAGDRILYRMTTPTRGLQEIALEVDTTGGITVPDVGRVIVVGQTLAQAETALQSRMQRFYRNAQVSLSLKELRTIQVTVTGESFAPGTYMVPSVATALNLLYATGGPTDEGSLRQIEIRRKGKVAGVIDFYKFFLTGDQTVADIPLQPGDVIYIPGRTSRVTVTGEVRRAAIYEIAPEESLKETLQFAGGLKASGVNQRVQVTTLQPGTARELKTVDLSQPQTAAGVSVFDGDVVEVFSVRDELTNVVTVDGAVDLPGQYAITNGMKVSDLVNHARGLLTDAYPTLAHLYRWKPDNTLEMVPINLEKALAGDVKENVVIQRWDRLTVYSRQEISWTGQRDVTIRGAVKNPGVYYRSENMRVRDLLLQAGGTAPSAYMERAYLLHQRPDGSFAYDTVDLTRAVAEDPKHNVLVEDHDILAIYTTEEARFTPERTVRVVGEVTSPGTYPRGDKMKLSDVIGVAGGLTARAGSRILVAHARRVEGEEALQVNFSPANGSVSPDPELQDGDVITVQGKSLIDTPGIVNVTGAVNLPGPIILNGPKVRLSEIIKLAGGMKPEAFPEGVMFTRNSDRLATPQQRQIMDVMNRLNDILNQADYKRALAASDVEKFRAISAAGKSGGSIGIPGVSLPEVNTPNPALSDIGKSLNSRELVSQPRSLSLEELLPKGSIAVSVPDALRKPGTDEDILMLDGDTIHVPVRPTTVQVVGAVMESRGVLFRDGANIQYYLDHAGGFTRDAAKDKIQVIRLGGGLMPANKVKKLLPGDVIMVPTQPMVAPIQNRSNQVDSIFRSLTNGALIVLVAKKLLGL